MACKIYRHGHLQRSTNRCRLCILGSVFSACFRLESCEITMQPLPLKCCESIHHTAKKAHGIIVRHGSVSMYREEISTVWKRSKIPCIYGNYHFHVSCNFYFLCYHYLLMTSMDPWNDFHRCMEWFPLVHGIIAMGPWNDFHGYMEIFPWVHGEVSVGRKASRYEFPWSSC